MPGEGSSCQLVDCVREESGSMTVDQLESGKMSAAASNRVRHVLFIMDRLPKTLGGGERVLLNILRLLPKDRFRCSVLTFDLEAGSVFEQLDCPLYVLPMRRTYDWTAAKMAVRLSKLIRSEHVEIVHTFFESSDIWGGFVTRLFSSARLISSRRDMGILRSTKHKIAYRMMGSFPDRILAVSEQVRQFCIVTDKVASEKVVTVYNGVEVPPRPDLVLRVKRRTQFGISENARVAVTVANIRRVKGLDVLVRAAGNVCRNNPEAVFLIAGGVLEQDHFEELKQLATSLSISAQIRFLGEQKDVRSILEMSDVFVLPSRNEGFSNALLEGMAAGLPCIATRVGGNGEAIQDQENGILIDSDDVNQLTEALGSLLQDPNRASVMGEKARAGVELRFTPERMISDLCRVYDSLP